jgi:hypothetical protein
MTIDLQFKIKENKYYLKYLRENSNWYKYLNRNPKNFAYFEEEVKKAYKLTKTDKFMQTLNTLELATKMLEALK